MFRRRPNHLPTHMDMQDLRRPDEYFLDDFQLQRAERIELITRLDPLTYLELLDRLAAGLPEQRYLAREARLHETIGVRPRFRKVHHRAEDVPVADVLPRLRRP